MNKLVISSTLIAAAVFAAFTGMDSAPTVSPPTPPGKWKMVYSHTSAGLFVSGDLNVLFTAVVAGADVKVGTGTIDGQGSYLTPVQVELPIINGVQHVGMTAKWISMIDNLNPIHVRSNPYFVNGWFCTNGGHAITRNSINNLANLGTTAGSSALRWYVRR